MNKLLYLLCFLLLVGCTTTEVRVSPIERTHIDIIIPKPLILRNVKWKVMDNGDTIYFALDASNYSNLALNTEDVQNRLFLQYNIINKMTAFYKISIDK